MVTVAQVFEEIGNDQDCKRREVEVDEREEILKHMRNQVVYVGAQSLILFVGL